MSQGIGVCWIVAGLLLVGVCNAPVSAAEASDKRDAGRVREGVQVLYDFASIDDGIVKDVSGAESPIDLRILDRKLVKHSGGALEIAGKTTVGSGKPATRLIRAIKKSEALTIEAWIRPSKLDQSGPARIVTLSSNSSERNVTLGQDSERYEVRLRTSETSANGIPSMVSRAKSLKLDWTHVVFTRDRSGQARVIIDGEVSVEQKVGGGLSSWDEKFQLALGNELTADRPWLGSYRLVAIYDRALSLADVQQNFRAGWRLAPPTAEERLAMKQAANERRFQMHIAPLISQHCLECHDASTREGGLDLSRKDAALAGGDGGPVLAPGDLAASRLWQHVEADEMPLDRTPLTVAEKGLLKEWIEAGATWSLDVVDPAVYAHGSGSAAVFVQRLTVPEYIETVRATLGVDVAKEARERLPRDLRADGFSNTAYNLNVDLAHVEAYAGLAEWIVKRVDVAALVKRHTSSRELTDENVTKVIEPVGRRLLRSPLSKEEITLYCGISTSVAGAGGDLDEAIAFVLEAMLQSPRFLYRIEGQRGDGSLASLTPYELASRMSYILWGGPPDDALWQAAEKDELDRDAVAKHIARMLADRRAIERSRLFVSDWLNLGRLDSLRPDPKRYPDWDAVLAKDMREETLAFFEDVVWKQNRPLTDLLNAQVSFVTKRLAKHYRISADRLPAEQKQRLEAAAASEWIRCDVSSDATRGGLLTQGSVLTVGGDDASTVTRGLFVMHELLRGVVRDPPPCVDTTPVPTQPGLSQRAIAESRLANSGCTGCHSKFEPLSFGLERYDGLGSYHEIDEHGNHLREDGEVLFPGREEPETFATAAELMDLLAGSERVAESFTWLVAQFAIGRPLGADDAATVAEIHRQTQRNGGTYQALMTAIVMSDLVQMTRTEPTP